MHGRNRHDYKRHKRDADTAAAWAHKAEKWYALEAALHQARQPPPPPPLDVTTTTKEPSTNHLITLELTRKALTVHPEPLYLWNQRRELLLLDSSNEQQQQPERLFSLETELEVTQTALQNNPKSYGAWWHRKWSVRQALCLGFEAKESSNSSNAISHRRRILEQELALTALFLQRDERNFHGWNYRRFIVSCQLACEEIATAAATTAVGTDGSWNIACWNGDVRDDDGDASAAGKENDSTTLWMGPQLTTTTTNIDTCLQPTTCDISSPAVQAILQQEWEFTTQKVQDNFSNYSAFHYRSKLVPLMVRVRAKQQQELQPQESHRATATATEEQLEKDENDVAVQRQLLQQELQLAEQAMFTEPDEYVTAYSTEILGWLRRVIGSKGFSHCIILLSYLLG